MHNLQTFEHNTLINKLLLMQFYLTNIRPKLHHRNWRKLRVTHALLTCWLFRTFLISPLMLFLAQPLSGNCYKLPSTVTFTFIHGIKVAAFAWYSVKIRVIFGVRSERRKVDEKANVHENCNMQTLF